jgi:AcrR family transcriptional regulator
MSAPTTTRDRILLESSILFAKQGYHNTSTREIAAAVGIRQPSLFYHFPSKTDIMATLLHEAIDGAVAAVESQLHAEGSPAERLHRYIVRDLLTVCQSPYDLAGTTTAAVMADPDFADIAERYQSLFEARTDLIRQGIEAGEFFPVNPEFASRVIEWTIEGLSTEIGAETPEDLIPMAIQIADFCVRALLVDCARVAAISESSQAAMDAEAE